MRAKHHLSARDLAAEISDRGEDLESLGKLLRFLIDRIQTAVPPESDDSFDCDSWFEAWKEAFVPCLEVVGCSSNLFRRI